MARPAEDPPEWATAGTNVTEPGSGQKGTGWALGQVAVSSYQNWWQNITYRWQAWLKGVFDGSEGDWRLEHSRTSASETPIRIAQGPEAHASGNAWRPILSANAGGSRNVRLFSGKLSQFEGAALTLNASWDPASQLWALEDSGQNATAVVLDHGGNGLKVWRKASGSSPWGPIAWDRGPAHISNLDMSGDLDVGGALDVVGDLGVAGSLNVSTNLDVNGTVDFSGSSSVTLHRTSDFLYDLTKTVVYIVDMREGQKDPNLLYIPQVGSAADVYRATADDAIIDVPLRVPPGCTLTNVTAVCEQASGGMVTMQVWACAPNFAGGGHIKASIGSVTSSGSAGVNILDLPVSYVVGESGVTGTMISARFTLANNAYVLMGIRVQISTTNPRHG